MLINEDVLVLRSVLSLEWVSILCSQRNKEDIFPPIGHGSAGIFRHVSGLLDWRKLTAGVRSVPPRRAPGWYVTQCRLLPAACCLLLASDVGDRQLSGDFVLLGFKLGKTSQLRRSKLRRKQELFIRTSMNWEGRDDIASKHWNQNEKGRKKTTAVVS